MKPTPTSTNWPEKLHATYEITLRYVTLCGIAGKTGLYRVQYQFSLAKIEENFGEYWRYMKLTTISDVRSFLMETELARNTSVFAPAFSPTDKFQHWILDLYLLVCNRNAILQLAVLKITNTPAAITLYDPDIPSMKKAYNFAVCARFLESDEGSLNSLGD